MDGGETIAASFTLGWPVMPSARASARSAVSRRSADPVALLALPTLAVVGLLLGPLLVGAPRWPADPARRVRETV